jgi:threonine/homoserine/homoserine lactone efflux protein
MFEQFAILTIFMSSFLIGFSGAASPGPLLAFSIKETLKSGWKAGPLIAIGHSILELFIVIGIAVGINQLFNSELIAKTISLFGGIMLIILGIQTIVSNKKVPISLDAKSTAGNSNTLLLQGALISLSNPYWFIWWVTIGATLIINSSNHGISGIVAMYIGHILADIIWYTAVSLILISGVKFLSNKFYQYLLLLCGIFLCFMGIYFIFSFFSI